MAKRLGNQLSRIARTEFDLSKLEEGNGLHELRRELRWFLIEVQVLNGLVQFKPGRRCPIRLIWSSAH